MTTSNQTIGELTRDSIIAAALRKIGFAKGQTPDSFDLADAQVSLNAMLMSFQADGMPLWKLSKYTLTMTANTATYTIGVGQTINIPYALKLHQVLRVPTAASTPIPLEQKSIYDYNRLPTNNTGTPVSYAYTPYTNYGVLRIWPAPATTDVAQFTLDLWYQKPFDLFTTGTETIDFPQYWQEAVIYGLAVRLAPEYGVPLNDRQILQKEASFFYDKALSFGNEDASLFIQPTVRMK